MKPKLFDWEVARLALCVGYRIKRCRRFVRLFDIDTGRQIKRYPIIRGKVLI